MNQPPNTVGRLVKASCKVKPIASSLPVLMACLRQASGPILELGGGEFSTRLINAFVHGDREALTVEQAGYWGDVVQAICFGKHPCQIVRSYDEARIEAWHWGIAFVDHAPAARRMVDLPRLKGRADLVICHDTESSEYGWDFTGWRHRFDFKALTPWTTVLSDTDDLGWLAKELEPWG